MSDSNKNDTGISGQTRRDFLRAGAIGGSLLAMPAWVAAAGRGESAPEAMTRSGRVRGFSDRGMNVFRGIPYGADTAAYRFRPAAVETPWDGVREALEFGAATPQRRDAEPTSEDCLFLNVTTPALRDGGKRPVLFYIHGGGYNNGSGSDPLYDGVNLCHQGDVVVITVNHRLNLFGYLYLENLAGPAYADSGNVGQLDLVQALQWVREHAAEFGGDPGNVTLFGQSGGGAKIATLMAMPAAKGLFHRAWTMSGQQVTGAGSRAATQRAGLFFEAAGAAPGDVDALLAMSTDQLLEAATVKDFSRVEDRSIHFCPVMDGDALPRHPFWPDAPPQSKNIPMVIGNTKDETRAWGQDEDFDLDWDQLPERIEKRQYVDISPDKVIAAYREMYPDYTPSEVYFAATTAGRSWRGAVEEAQARAEQGAPTWVYQLDWGSPIEGGRRRAFHTLDIPLVFNNTAVDDSPSGDAADARRMADRMSGALLAFARTGNPNFDGIPAWDQYTLPTRETMLFDDPSQMANDPRGGERAFYSQVPFIQRGTI
ncbi:carboxylesterase/lipase family protein [Marinihelvus fidelis]|uniref:Carboxylic ester hydrolase n=1 Tax=Marinihelvus fidelis TaxID=2613842 RepID=A0A5N0T8Z8_9GAMM|nr:carboxylesterase family protein [Marinihelvus fidelis]KAA9129769.1 carboxylesterase/lipase family protein [Marinihelvus fidelis]